MAEENKIIESEPTPKVDTEVAEAVKIDSKIKLAALALLNFKKLIAILLTIGLVAAGIALAVSGWTCGKVTKSNVEIKK